MFSVFVVICYSVELFCFSCMVVGGSRCMYSIVRLNRLFNWMVLVWKNGCCFGVGWL